MAIFYKKSVEGEYEIYTYLRARIRLLQILIIGGLGLFIVFMYSNLPLKEYVVLFGVGSLFLGCLLSAFGGIQQVISQIKSGTLFIKQGQERKITRLYNGNIEVRIKTIK